MERLLLRKLLFTLDKISNQISYYAKERSNPIILILNLTHAPTEGFIADSASRCVYRPSYCSAFMYRYTRLYCCPRNNTITTTISNLHTGDTCSCVSLRLKSLFRNNQELHLYCVTLENRTFSHAGNAATD